MNALSKFARGDVVRPAYSTQGLLPTKKYVVTEVVVRTTAFGGFTDYYVQDVSSTGAPVIRVGNGHLILQRAEA